MNANEKEYLVFRNTRRERGTEGEGEGEGNLYACLYINRWAKDKNFILINKST